MVVPSGIVTTGWPRVEAQCADMGITFDAWQSGAGRIILGKRVDGTYAATVGGVVISIPRQVGKTFLIAAIVFAMCVLFPGLRVVWTAHRTRTATNTFRSLQGLARRPRIAPHVDHVRTANGEQEIGFRNGSVIMFGARESGFGRGIDAIDIEVFDEAQILTEKALDDMVAATNTARHPHGALLFYTGTPPRPIDPGEVFSARREEALSGKSDDMVYLEFSADPDADPDDREQWSVANPSFPDRTPLASMLRMRKNLTSDDSWMREALGVWDQVGVRRLFPGDSWSAAADRTSLPMDSLALGIEAAPDLSAAAISLAGRRSDDRWHIELHEQRTGSAWVAGFVVELLQANPVVRAVAIDEGSPSAALVGDLRRAGVRLVSPTVRELGAACALLLEGVVTGSVVHTDQHQMTSAAMVATKRVLGQTGLWTFSRPDAGSDILPIQSAALALWASRLEKTRPPLIKRSTERRAVVL